jgi:hypothetical protein
LKIEDVRVGMLVRAIKKSINPETFDEFFEYKRDGIGMIKGIGKHSGGKIVVIVETWNFAAEDLVWVEGEPVKDSYLYVGAKVRAVRKSIDAKDFELFLKRFPSAVGIITSVDFLKNVVSIDGFCFSKDDLVRYTADAEPKVFKGEVVGKKVITIQSLLRAGACHDKVSEFAQIVVKYNPHYAFEPIPPAYAQEIACILGFPEWLEKNNFINRVKEDVVKDVQIVDSGNVFDIRVLSNGDWWNIISIYKDGTGIHRCINIPKTTGICVNQYGKITEV